MVYLTRLVLDVLKPHRPSILEFAEAIAALGAGYCVSIDVKGVDEATEDVMITIEAADIEFDTVDKLIDSLGGSLHSTDGVQVVSRRSEG